MVNSRRSTPEQKTRPPNENEPGHVSRSLPGLKRDFLPVMRIGMGSHRLQNRNENGLHGMRMQQAVSLATSKEFMIRTVMTRQVRELSALLTRPITCQGTKETPTVFWYSTQSSYPPSHFLWIRINAKRCRMTDIVREARTNQVNKSQAY